MKKAVLDAIGKEMSKMYGEVVLTHPEVWWDTEKEKKYRESLKNQQKEDKVQEKQTLINNEVLIINKLFITSSRTCDICKTNFCGYYDEMYLNKFGCCYKCYIMYCEGREDKWETRKRQLLQKNK